MKSISKRKPARRKAAAPKPTHYRIMVMGERVNTMHAIREEVQQTYELRADIYDDVSEAGVEALRLAAQEHPSWRKLTARPLS